MGWLRDTHPDHEGFAVALVQRDRCEHSRLYRELQYPLDDHPRFDVIAIQAGCDCGWRSPYLRPDGAASWGPFSAIVSERDDERIHFLWSQHIEAAHPTRGLFPALDRLADRCAELKCAVREISPNKEVAR